MARNRSVRVAALGSPPQRPAAPASGIKTRPSGPLLRRAVVIGLTVLSLALLSIYFRESDSGALHDLQSGGAVVLRPFEEAADRVAQPFQDAADWFGGVLDAKSDAEKLRAENDRLRRQASENAIAVQENEELKRLIALRDSPRFPKDFRAVAARVISRPPSQFVQQVVITAGSNDGVQVHSPVVTADGLAGQVTKVAKDTSLVTLLTDSSSAVSALDVRTKATGVVRPNADTLLMDRVTKARVVNNGDVLVTAGSDIYPKGLLIGRITSWNQTDTDTYKSIEVGSFVDFGSLEFVDVYVRLGEGG